MGGGDTAMEEASFLTNLPPKSILFTAEINFSLQTYARAREAEPKIECLMNSNVTELQYDSNGLNGIVITNLLTGENKIHKTDGLFWRSATPLTRNFCKDNCPDEKGFIKTLNGTPETGIPGVFAAGDVQDSYYRQAITAAGSGCEAAIRVERYLANRLPSLTCKSVIYSTKIQQLSSTFPTRPPLTKPLLSCKI